MKLYFMKKEALEILKSNLDLVYNKYYTEKDNKWLWQVCGGDPFVLYKEVPDFHLANLDSESSVGEIEFENFKGTVYDHWPFQLKINDIIGNDGWEVVNDITLNTGREIVSDILIDEIDTWKKIRDVCVMSKQYGFIGSKSSLHVHIGSQILGNKTCY